MCPRQQESQRHSPAAQVGRAQPMEGSVLVEEGQQSQWHCPIQHLEHLRHMLCAEPMLWCLGVELLFVKASMASPCIGSLDIFGPPKRTSYEVTQG